MANMLVLVVLMFASIGMVFSQAPSMAPPDCNSAITNLAECLSFVQYGSKLEKPQGLCCAGLKKVVKDEVSCLCEAFKQSSSFGIKLNMTKAFGLPHACGISTPSLSNCKIDVAGSPGSAPAPSPSSPGASFANSPASAPGTHSMAPLQAPSMFLFIIYIAVPLYSSSIIA
ncbi:non-specific lipid transfer protein GPI-anchored 11-like [Dioscorea cayenensis subsp. rotundata]|uniref:Non-specific lipid transfer protein GPI-anchored 11-like n=1 Tax=Dioscorea cayennensis subsp. rotundata TaxID=55577 RepID=A0AB40BEM1_DIOCR|nr:non-specific lipid transfer protein GPI-anchored 11-like [Dioscorea cayenensis subsp. rotundata]